MTPVELWQTVADKPHVWLCLGFAVPLAGQCWRCRQPPAEGDIIEMFGYAAGIYGAAVLLKDAYEADPAGKGWMLFTSGCVLMVATLKGAARLLGRMTPRPDLTPEAEAAAAPKIDAA